MAIQQVAGRIEGKQLGAQGPAQGRADAPGGVVGKLLGATQAVCADGELAGQVPLVAPLDARAAGLGRDCGAASF